MGMAVWKLCKLSLSCLNISGCPETDLKSLQSSGAFCSLADPTVAVLSQRKVQLWNAGLQQYQKWMFVGELEEQGKGSSSLQLSSCLNETEYLYLDGTCSPELVQLLSESW